MKKLFVTLIVLIVIIIGLWYWASKAPKPEQPAPAPVQTEQGTKVSYACAAGKSIDATFYDGTSIPGTADTPPVPGGSAHVVLSDGRTLDLKQTLSADGVRYSNGDPSVKQGEPGAETFVFWSKGNGALVLENNVEKSYIGCVQASNDASLPQTYVSPTGAFSIRLPQGYTPDAKYQYQMSPKTVIHGTKFTVPASFAKGTNLGSDSYISVEQIPNTTSCTADKFFDVGPNGIKVQTVADNGTTYSYLTSTDAAAGNRYEETVYAIQGTNPCTAIRYFIHFAVFENYPAGTVTRFDEAGLKTVFDRIRRSLMLGE